MYQRHIFSIVCFCILLLFFFSKQTSTTTTWLLSLNTASLLPYANKMQRIGCEKLAHDRHWIWISNDLHFVHNEYHQCSPTFWFSFVLFHCNSTRLSVNIINWWIITVIIWMPEHNGDFVVHFLCVHWTLFTVIPQNMQMSFFFLTRNFRKSIGNR